MPDCLDGAAIANLGMGNMGHGFVEQRRYSLCQGAALYRSLAGHRAAAKAALVLSNEEQLVDSIEIYQTSRLGQAKVHRWHQALSSGQELGISTIVREQNKRFVNATRRVIVKGRGFHPARPLHWPHMPTAGGKCESRAMIFYSSTNATARQKAASPPLNNQGKTPTVSRLFCNSGAPICPPMFSTCMQS